MSGSIPPSPVDLYIDDIARLADMLRARGVRSFDSGNLRLELWPAPPASPAPTLRSQSTSMTAPPSDRCRCGHLVWEHMNGLCTDGCDAEKCVESEAAQ